MAFLFPALLQGALNVAAGKLGDHLRAQRSNEADPVGADADVELDELPDHEDDGLVAAPPHVEGDDCA